MRLKNRYRLGTAAVYLLGAAGLEERLEEHGLIVLVEGLVGPRGGASVLREELEEAAECVPLVLVGMVVGTVGLVAAVALAASVHLVI